jgi:hypothetical protein
MSWANDIKGVKICLTYDPVEVSIYHNEAWTGTPMTQQTVFDVVVGERFFDQDIVVEEDHGWARTSNH